MVIVGGNTAFILMDCLGDTPVEFLGKDIELLGKAAVNGVAGLQDHDHVKIAGRSEGRTFQGDGHNSLFVLKLANYGQIWKGLPLKCDMKYPGYSPSLDNYFGAFGHKSPCFVHIGFILPFRIGSFTLYLTN